MENLVALPVEITQPEEDAEQALVEQAKTDSATFGILYERYAMYVYHYLRTRVETDEIRFYNKSTSLDLGPGGVLDPTQLSIAGKRYDAHPFPIDHPNIYGWFSRGSSNFVSFYDSLRSQTGTWTVTEEARVWTGTSFQNSHLDTWTFTFTIS